MYIFSGTTNRLELIDDALLRRGRLGVKVKIGMPDKKGRFDILNIHTAQIRKSNMLDSDVDLWDLAEKTDGFSGADIEGLVKDAVNIVMQRCMKVNVI